MNDRSKLILRIQNAIDILSIRDAGGICPHAFDNVNDETIIKSIMSDAASLLNEATP